MNFWFKETRTEAVSLGKTCETVSSQVCSASSVVNMLWSKEEMKTVKMQGNGDDEENFPFQNERTRGLENVSEGL